MKIKRERFQNEGGKLQKTWRQTSKRQGGEPPKEQEENPPDNKEDWKE